MEIEVVQLSVKDQFMHRPISSALDALAICKYVFIWNTK